MDFLTQALLAAVYVIAKSALERVQLRIGERIGDTVYDKFLALLEQRHPKTAKAIREQTEEFLDYRELFQEIESEAQTNQEFAETTYQLALTAKENPLPNLNTVLQNFAVIEELKPQILELQSLISVWQNKMVSTDEIKQFLPDATDEQTQRYATQLKRLGRLESFFSDYPQELNGYEDLLSRARKAFNYKQPYRIAVIGIAGAGKSTMLNAMLGRELVLAKFGRATTGAALEIFLNVPETEEENAIVKYRDQDNILQLISDHFVQRYGLDQSKFNGKLDDKFFEALKSSPYPGIDQEAKPEFDKLRQILLELHEQYMKNYSSNPRTFFSLNEPADVKELMELIDENSEINIDINKRRIGLVKSVTYHIKPDKNSHGVQTLQLPNNVCLVDLPGLDGSPLHDIIIGEGIKDADAVIFIMRPPRILGRGDDALLKRVQKYISPQGIEQSGERIFIVLNAKDTIPTDNPPSNLLKEMDYLMKYLPDYASPQLKKRGGDTPYFMTSAWAAYSAKKKMRGESIEDPKTYESILLKFGGKDKSDQEVLEQSQVPKLVEELTKFARDKRIEGQIRDGKQALDSIINPLYSKYDSEYNGLKATQGETYFKELVENKLHEKQKQLKYQLVLFRQNVLDNLTAKQKDLDEKAKNICDKTDDQLEKHMPQIWVTHFNNDIASLQGAILGQSFLEPVLDDAQMYLWSQLNQRLPELATYFVEFYKDEFQKQHTNQKILDGCLNYPNIVEKLESRIKTLIQNMDSRIKEMSERIAMTKMTAPINYFTYKTQEGNHKQQDLFDKLKEIELKHVVPAENFNSFIKQVRQLYEEQVCQECVFALMNLYRYELIDIEKGLSSFIRDAFFEIRDSGDPYQIAQLLKIPDSELKGVQLLKDKLAALTSIKE